MAWKNFGLLSTLALAVFVGCGPAETVTDINDLDLGTDGATLEGAVVIDGSSTVYPISEAAAAAFREEQPNVSVTVGKSGTGGGFKRFLKNETDISDASRPIKKNEFDSCAESQVAFIELPIAYDGLTFVVNKENTFVDQLTVDQLKQIFRESDNKALTWKDVNDAWPDEKIALFAPGTDSGTFDYFKEVIEGKDEGVNIRGDMSTSEEDNVLVNGVAGAPFALGFFGCSYYYENQDKLNAVAIVNSAGEAVGPEKEAIENGSYNPFSRPLFIYVKASSLASPQVSEFVDYYVNHAGKLAGDSGYVALPESVYEMAKKHLDEKLTGTHFMDKQGEKIKGSVTDLYKAEAIVDIE